MELNDANDREIFSIWKYEYFVRRQTGMKKSSEVLESIKAFEIEDNTYSDRRSLEFCSPHKRV